MEGEGGGGAPEIGYAVYIFVAESFPKSKMRDLDSAAGRGYGVYPRVPLKKQVEGGGWQGCLGPDRNMLFTWAWPKDVPHIARGEGVYLITTDGKRILDFNAQAIPGPLRDPGRRGKGGNTETRISRYFFPLHIYQLADKFFPSFLFHLFLSFLIIFFGGLTLTLTVTLTSGE